MSTDPLAMLLRSFKLPTMAARYAETLASAEEHHWGYRKFLLQLCEAEGADRQERKRGSDCQRKLSPGGGNQPMLIARSIAAGVRGAPPAVHQTCCDRRHDDKCEPAVRGVEKSFGSDLPSGHRQAKQTENGSNTYACQGESKG